MNPFVVVFPRKDNLPLLLDYATSAIAFQTWCRLAIRRPRAARLPIDVNGVPTTNPAVMQESPLGSLLTFANIGYALAAMCEILGGALSGGKTTHQETLQPVPCHSMHYHYHHQPGTLRRRIEARILKPLPSGRKPRRMMMISRFCYLASGK
ncbi:Ldh family oxidoreductase [Escherichia coli]